MADSEFLTRAEVRDLTDRERTAAQRRVLDRMGIRYRARPDGSPVVLRRHIDSLLGAKDAAPREPELHL